MAAEQIDMQGRTLNNRLTTIEDPQVIHAEGFASLTTKGGKDLHMM